MKRTAHQFFTFPHSPSSSLAQENCLPCRHWSPVLLGNSWSARLSYISPRNTLIQLWFIQMSGPQCLPKQTGDRTECALLQLVLDLDEYYPFIRKDHPEESFVKVFNFNSERKSMTTVIPDDDGFKIYSKGAPEVILNRCAGIVRHDGSVGKFQPEDAVALDQIIKNMQEKSQLKVMCIAYRHVYSSGG